MNHGNYRPFGYRIMGTGKCLLITIYHNNNPLVHWHHNSYAQNYHYNHDSHTHRHNEPYVLHHYEPQVLHDNKPGRLNYKKSQGLHNNVYYDDDDEDYVHDPNDGGMPENVHAVRKMFVETPKITQKIARNSTCCTFKSQVNPLQFTLKDIGS